MLWIKTKVKSRNPQRWTGKLGTKQVGDREVVVDSQDVPHGDSPNKDSKEAGMLASQLSERRTF